MLMRMLPFLLSLLILSGCEQYAVSSTPKKKPLVSNTPLTLQAEKNFWDTLHQGRYENLSHTIELLTRAYLQNPFDPRLASHLGFAHIWKITERGRLPEVPASIVNEIILANKYFSDAVELNPHDPRILGFLADSRLVEGQIFKNERQQTRAFFMLKRAIRAWPQFNYFAAGYPMSTLPADSEHFKQGLEWQWKTLEVCAKHKIDRKNPDYSPYMKLETQQGPERACWNSWIAPHNFEGFFLNMGDMLVKNGDWQTAIKIYKNAMLAKSYSNWPFRALLENRIAHAKENVAYFQGSKIKPPEKTILFNSGYGCVACHQSGSLDRKIQENK